MIHITFEELRKTLTSSGFVDAKQFEAALDEAKKTDRSVTNILIEHGDVSEEYLAKILADYFKIDFISLTKTPVESNFLKMLPEPIAKLRNMVVFGKTDQGLKLAMIDPGDLEAIRYAELATGQKIIPYITTESDLREALGGYQKTIVEDFEQVIKDNVARSGPTEDTLQAAQDLPVITILNTIIEYALSQRASDIHLERLPKDLIVRMRVDGRLKDVITLPTSLHSALVARIKVLSNLKIDEHRLPQDGRFRYENENHNTAMRVSVIPAFYGEKVVIRLLEESERFLTLSELGLSKNDLAKVEAAIAKPHGMILSTGPTGSGKTTTLYTILHLLNQPEVNISTIEDPIEYDIKRVNQIQVNPKIGLTFADGLRSLLRQDPDILMVGEIRDKETAEMAVHSALTGHLLLSSLHTNDAATAIPRLLDIGIEPFLLASTLNIVIAQRLVRRICRDCITTVKLNDEQKKHYGEQITVILKDAKSKENPALAVPEKAFRGKGCRACGGQGFKGRVGIYEILQMSPKIQDMIINRASAEALRKQAISEGMTTLLQDGLSKIQAGLTTFEEVILVTRE